MKQIILLVSIIYSSVAGAQTLPPPAAANLAQKQLINEFIEASHYKEALINYAKNYLEGKRFNYDTNPPKELITKEQARSIIDHFDFEGLRFSLQSSLSFISEENLKELVKFHKSIGGKLSKNNTVLLMTPAIDFNVKNQIEYAIENTKNKR
jgi:hemolysin activation/secretion protein